MPRRFDERWTRTVVLATVLALVLAGVGAVTSVSAAPSITIERVTTTEGDELVTGVVAGQPIVVGVRYTGLGGGVHEVMFRDDRSGEPVLNTTVVGDAGERQIGVSGAALSPAYGSPAPEIDLVARVDGSSSGAYPIEKVAPATMYLTDVPARAGRNETVSVSYYGWTRGEADVHLSADAPPLGYDGGEDVRIDRVAVTPPSGATLPHLFEGTITFTPGDYLEPGEEVVVIQIRGSERPDPDVYWGNDARIRIVNDRPIAEFSYAPGAPQPDELVSFDAGASRDPDGTVVRYEWDFDGDGRHDESGRRVNWAFPTPGSKTVTLTVTDDLGATGTLRVRLGVIAPPRPVFDVSPPDPAAGRPVTFDARGSTDPDGTIDRYAWDFDGDGRTDGLGPVVNHTYPREGTYEVTLAATDDAGVTNATRLTVAVRPVIPPAANLAYRPRPPTANRTVTFDASGSTDPDGRIVRYEWAFGDGNRANATDDIVHHTYAEGGPYTVALTAVDDDGATHTIRADVRVNAPPEVRLDVPSTAPLRNTSVSFDAGASRDADGRIVRYAWTFGDGAAVNTTEPVVVHTYTAYGDYTARLTVTDDVGASTSRSVTIDVYNRAPIARFSIVPRRPRADKAVEFDARAATDPDGQIVDRRWDFDGDGTTDATGPVVRHTFGEQGTYPVALTVEDEQGATNTTVREIRVGPLVPLMEIGLIAVLLAWLIVFFWLSGVLPTERYGVDLASLLGRADGPEERRGDGTAAPDDSGGPDGPTEDVEGSDTAQARSDPGPDAGPSPGHPAGDTER